MDTITYVVVLAGAATIAYCFMLLVGVIDR